MSGFADIQAGYVVALGALAAYSASLIARERAARRRLGGDASEEGAPIAAPVEPPGRPPAGES